MDNLCSLSSGVCSWWLCIVLIPSSRLMQYFSIISNCCDLWENLVGWEMDYTVFYQYYVSWYKRGGFEGLCNGIPGWRILVISLIEEVSATFSLFSSCFLQFKNKTCAFIHWMTNQLTYSACCFNINPISIIYRFGNWSSYYRKYRPRPQSKQNAGGVTWPNRKYRPRPLKFLTQVLIEIEIIEFSKAWTESGYVASCL